MPTISSMPSDSSVYPFILLMSCLSSSLFLLLGKTGKFGNQRCSQPKSCFSRPLYSQNKAGKLIYFHFSLRFFRVSAALSFSLSKLNFPKILGEGKAPRRSQSSAEPAGDPKQGLGSGSRDRTQGMGTGRWKWDWGWNSHRSWGCPCTPGNGQGWNLGQGKLDGFGGL